MVWASYSCAREPFHCMYTSWKLVEEEERKEESREDRREERGEERGEGASRTATSYDDDDDHTERLEGSRE